MPKTIEAPAAISPAAKARLRDLFMREGGRYLVSRLALWALGRAMDAYPEAASMGAAEARAIGVHVTSMSRMLGAMIRAGWLSSPEPGKGLLCANKIVEG